MEVSRVSHARRVVVWQCVAATRQTRHKRTTAVAAEDTRHKNINSIINVVVVARECADTELMKNA